MGHPAFEGVPGTCQVVLDAREKALSVKALAEGGEFKFDLCLLGAWL